MAFEEILEAFPRDIEWRETIRIHLISHIDALKDVNQSAYSPRLKCLIKEVMHECENAKQLEKAA